MDALSGLSRDEHRIIGRDRKGVFDLRLDLLGLSRWQVNLVDRRDDVKVRVHGEVGIRHGLGLDPLSRVNDQDRALAGGKRSAYLVGKVDMARGVYEIERIGVAIVGMVEDPHGI